jgi:hypothetical protein
MSLKVTPLQRSLKEPIGVMLKNLKASKLTRVVCNPASSFLIQNFLVKFEGLIRRVSYRALNYGSLQHAFLSVVQQVTRVVHLLRLEGLLHNLSFFIVQPNDAAVTVNFRAFVTCSVHLPRFGKLFRVFRY